MPPPPVRTLIGYPFGERHGGAEAVLLTLLREQETAGIDAAVWFGEPGGFRDEVAAIGVQTLLAAHPGWSPRGVASAIRAVVAHVRREQPDVLVSWLPRAHLVIGAAAGLTGMGPRTVAWQHTVPVGNWRHRILHSLPAATVVTVSEASAVAQRGHRPRRPVAVVHGGIEEPERPSEAERARLRSELRLRDDLPLVVIVGRLIAWKGQERLLEAVALLRERGVDCQLLVVGGEDPNENDGTWSRLHARRSALGLGDRVVLAGPRTDAISLIALADVVVNASTPEPFGLVLLEALALGVAAVGVDRGGPREILDGGRCGVLVASGAPGALADALEQLLADPAARARLATAGRARFEEHFTAAHMANRAGAILRGVAGARATVRDPGGPRDRGSLQ